LLSYELILKWHDITKNKEEGGKLEYKKEEEEKRKEELEKKGGKK